MPTHTVVDHAQWLAARKQLLAREKEFTRLRDELSAARRELPWERVEKVYEFESVHGRETLASLFGTRSQLVVYHFMFDPTWDVSCKSCAFWADNFNGIVPHLAQRDVAFVATSRAPLTKLTAQATRLGWTFPWVSAVGDDFNHDYNVTFTAEAIAAGGAPYNYDTDRVTAGNERPGISVFVREGDTVYHSYSTYARGLDMMNTAYHYLDLTPKGRDEDSLPFTMQWVQLRDLYPR